MDFNLTKAQSQVLERLEGLLVDRPTFPDSSERKIEADLLARLREEKLLALVVEGERSGVLDTALVVERLSRAAATVPAGIEGLVLPLFGDVPRGIAVLKDSDIDGPYRFAAQGDLVISYQGATASLHRQVAGSSTVANTNYVYPMGMLGPVDGPALATVPASDVRRRHRIAIASETIGAMDAVMEHMVAFLSQREQFGRKIGSFQAIHHRMAELSVLLESGRWLSREAAWLDGEEAAALAAAHISKSGRRMCWEAHQMSGARGFTLDAGLYEHTLRLQALSIEGGGVQAHADSAAEMARAA